MGLNGEASAALVFLILYSILFSFLLFAQITGRIKFKSRFSVLLFHMTVRLASQATGVAFGIVGYKNINLLIAYFILGAEGYFTLVLCAYRFLVSYQYHNSLDHNSWIDPRHPEGTSLGQRFMNSFRASSTDGGKRKIPLLVIIHYLLIGANAIIISGGSLLSGDIGEKSQEKIQMDQRTAKAMRTAGQAIFLAINAFLLFCIVHSIQKYKREHKTSTIHPTLILLLLAWPLLFVRGIYGVLQSAVDFFSYFNLNNFTNEGLSTGFIVAEYVMGTTMEWASCALLLGTYFTSKNDPPKGKVLQPGEKEAQPENSPHTGYV